MILNNNFKKVLGLFALAIFMISATAQEKIKVTSLVNPFMGVHGGGNMHPAATLPYSPVSLGPDVASVQSPSGYGYTANRRIIGFSHARTSGTGGGGRYGTFGVLPQVGKVNLAERTAGLVVKNDFASPGYYTCDFDSSKINVELTLSEHVGFHQYTFNEGDTATILLDLASVRLTRDVSKCLEAHVEIVSDKVVKGWGKYSGGWGNSNPYKVYFYAEFEKGAFEKGTWNKKIIGKDVLKADANDKTDLSLGAYFKFMAGKNSKQVRFKLAMSYTGFENAQKYFNEIPNWDFAACKKAAETKWEQFLSRIKVEGGTPDQQKIFYSAFYRQAMIPRDLTGDNPLWASNEPHFWDFFTFWDTYRTTNPLLTVIDTKKASEIVRCLLDIYQHKGWLPDAWTGGDYGSIQGGSNSDVVVAEAILKDIKGFDYELAYKAMLTNATKQSPYPLSAGRFVNLYDKYGYLPQASATDRNNPPCGTSRTIECCYNDYCIALAARKMGKMDDYNKFLKRSESVFEKLFYEPLKIFWAKDTLGQFIPGATKYETTGKWVNGQWGGWNGPFYEGSAASYSCSALQDVERMIKLHGGKDEFVKFLDEIFGQGHYESDNEPGMHLPFLYIYAGENHKTYERLHELLNKEYRATRDGWPGNDDAGTTSAWYIWASMGIYPMAGQDIYVLTTPTFKKSEFMLESGKTFSIESIGLSETNTYIQSATLNGKPFNQPWIRHSNIMNGGKLVFVMGNKPSNWGKDNLPPSFNNL